MVIWLYEIKDSSLVNATGHLQESLLPQSSKSMISQGAIEVNDKCILGELC